MFKKLFTALISGFLGLCALASASEGVSFITVSGAGLAPFSSEIVSLCNSVYREYPYLYAGEDDDYDYYNAQYADASPSICILAFDEDRIVGVALAIRAQDAAKHYKQVLIDQGIDLSTIFYLAELVILPEYRGLGYGTSLFKQVEQFAKDTGTFEELWLATIDESERAYPAPEGYRSLDNFWTKMGFIKHPEVAFYTYYEYVGESDDSPQHMVFWSKALYTR